MEMWFISDTHFAHANILTFKREDGSPVRSFNSVEEMDETMIQRWNESIKPQDHVWHLGDFTMLRGGHIKSLDFRIMSRLQGHKRLILGNHDHGTLEWYAKWFEKVRGSHRIDRTMLFSHFPIYPESVPKGCINIHGHIHERKATPPYFNISVERTDYRPIHFDVIKSWLGDYK